MVDLSAQHITNRSLSSSNARTVAFQVLRWVTVIGLLVGLQVGYASVTDKILMIQYEIERLKNANSSLVERNEELTLELNALSAPQEVDQIAARLGLIRSNDSQVIILQGNPGYRTQNQIAQTRPQIQTEVLHE